MKGRTSSSIHLQITIAVLFSLMITMEALTLLVLLLEQL